MKRVGRELGVRYVLEGSVRKGGNRVRITGQLIDAATGSHLWADRFDGSLEDVFDLQDKVAASVAGVIEPALQAAETARSADRPTADLTAYDLYLRAYALALSSTRQIPEALRLLEQAIALDPGYSWAKAFAGYIHVLRATQGWSSPEDLVRGPTLAREALLSSRDEPNTIAFAAHALAYLAREYDIPIAAMDRALHLNANSANILSRSGWLRNWVADTDRAIEHFLRSIRLNPVDPLLGQAYGGLAYAHILTGEYEKALQYARRSTHELPRWIAGWMALAVAAAHIGDLQEANAAAKRILEMRPVWLAQSPFRDRWVRDRIVHGLRLAGMHRG